MKKIGNIFTKNRILDSNWCNVTDKKENLIESIPTLVIGVENAKNFSQNFNILDWKIDDKTYWTFGKREKRNIYEKRIDEFLNLCLNFQKNSVKYEFFNVLTEDRDKKKSFFDEISNSEGCVCFLHNDMLYFYMNDSNKVTGVSLRDINYNGMNQNNLLSKLQKMNNVKIYTNKYDFPLPVRQFLMCSTYVSPKLCE